MNEENQKISSPARRSRILNRYLNGKEIYEEIIGELAPGNSNEKLGSPEGILEQLNEKTREETLVFYLVELTADEKKLLAPSKNKQYSIKRRHLKVVKRSKMK